MVKTSGNYPSVLHISTASSWRGGERQVAYLYRELDKKGIPQLLLCPENSALHRFCLENNFPHETVKKNGLLNYYRWPSAIARICKKEEIRLIHAHESNAHSFAVLANDWFKCSTSMIVSRRVVFPIRQKKFTLYKYNHPMLKKILCDAEAVKAVLLPHVKDPGKLVVIPPGVDLKKFKPGGENMRLKEEFHLPEGARIVGTIAALTEEKDIFTFIDTAADFLRNHPDRKVVFFIIGDGKLALRLKAYAQERKIPDSVIFTGFRKDIDLILPQLDVLLMTSLSESINSSILDAMACRVPVVTTKAGGNAEVVKQCETGMLAELKDAQKLSEGLWKMLTDETLRNHIVNNAYEQIQDFSIAAVAGKTVNEYI